MGGVPASIAQIEATLQREYDTALSAARKQHDDALDAAFVSITDPVDTANKDIHRFLQRYFLQQDKKLDMTKAPKALPLPGLHSRSALHAAAHPIAGLHTASGGSDDSSAGLERVLVIGADRAAVWAEANKINAEHDKLQRQQCDKENEERMEQHREFLAENKGKKGTAKRCYNVFCDAIEQDWPGDCADGLTLEIIDDSERRGSLAAEFEWGVLDGLMRFCKEGEVLEDSDSEEDDEDDDLEELSGSRKRKLTSKGAKNSTKKGKKEKNDPFKLYFVWRGRETGEGEIQNDNDQRGWIQFQDKKFLKFGGEVSVGFIGSRVKFQGFKVSADAGPINKLWGDYSDRAYEMERVRRWR
ncbi:hypothetical protein K440DRAFT_664660 [Wilcoxina mikolae CBS 423.85]|nr:hypothetical protein K440DRAFT_664660 [Wilcoxina mikolae CBS 423.85]